MTEHDREEELLRQVRRTLDESVERMDAATASRITQARHAALKTGPALKSLWLPTAAAVAASAAVVAVIVARAPDETAPVLEDIELIAAPDELDLYRDLEFYAWLDTHEPTG